MTYREPPAQEPAASEPDPVQELLRLRKESARLEQEVEELRRRPAPGSALPGCAAGSALVAVVLGLLVLRAGGCSF